VFGWRIIRSTDPSIRHPNLWEFSQGRSSEAAHSTNTVVSDVGGVHRASVGAAPAEFTAARPAGDEVVFANPAHDFPQRFPYRRSSCTE
jgi:hypothetical protein